MEQIKDTYESERRQTTVMFADIAGFTAISETMDPEEIRLLTNECFKTLGSIIKKHEGTIDKFIGDSIMVVFGIPHAVEDAHRKAVNAAIEMRNKLYELNKQKKLKVPLDIHIGISSGLVVTGTIGSEEKKEFTVLGDTVNLASRLEEITGRGQIFVGPTTYRNTRNDFQYRELEPVTLKGKKEPVLVYELLSQKTVDQLKRWGERIIYSKMVGRDEELQALENCVLQVTSGNGAIVAISGEAGIGKSRLTSELKRKDILKEVTLLEGRAIPIGQNLNYHLINDALRRWMTIKEDDSESEAQQKLEAHITAIIPEEALEIYPFIATVMGIKLTGTHTERIRGLEGETLEKFILKSLRDLIVRSAEAKPLVFIWEDIHWADASSLSIIESLLRLTENYSILFVNIFRTNPEEALTKMITTARENYKDRFHEITLKPLDSVYCEALIKNLLNVQGLPTRIAELIMKKTEGNPFFIEEIGRSFLDEGVIEIKDGKFVITSKIESAYIPETIQDILLARVDRLEEGAKSLIKTASVIGRNFHYRILQELVETIEDIDAKLQHLKEIQLILEKNGSGEPEYMFKHALAQEAVYDSLLLQKRRELHAMIAQAIENVFSERLRDFYGTLAFHYTRAENLEKAEEYLAKAGEEALKVAASQEALKYYQEALNLYRRQYGEAGDPEKIVNMENAIAIAYYNRGQMTEAIIYMDRVLAHWGEKRHHNKIAVILSLLVTLGGILKNLYYPSKKPKKIPDLRDTQIVDMTYLRGTALAAVDKTRFFIDTLGLIKKLNELELKNMEKGALMYSASSALFCVSGLSFNISRKILDYGKANINPKDKKTLFLTTFFELMHNYLSGNWEMEIPHNREIVEYYIKKGEIFPASGILLWSGLMKIEQGQFDRVKTLVEELYRFGEDYENDYVRVRWHILNCLQLLKTRNLRELQQTVVKGIAFTNKVNQVQWSCILMGLQIQSLLLENDLNGAKNSLHQAKNIMAVEKHLNPIFAIYILTSELTYHLQAWEQAVASGNQEEISQFAKSAQESGKKAVKIAMKYAASKTEVFRLMGTTHWLLGKEEKAKEWWEKSIATGVQLKANPELARTYREVGKRLTMGGKTKQLSGTSPEEFHQKAQDLFEQMNLTWDLDRLHREIA